MISAGPIMANIYSLLQWAVKLWHWTRKISISSVKMSWEIKLNQKWREFVPIGRLFLVECSVLLKLVTLPGICSKEENLRNKFNLQLMLEDAVTVTSTIPKSTFCQAERMAQFVFGIAIQKVIQKLSVILCITTKMSPLQSLLVTITW